MFEIIPIGYVESTRKNVEDDFWGGLQSRIVLTDAIEPAALDGLEEFSHAEIIFIFHQVAPEKIVCGARHPRNNPAWPKVGIFAQRGKNRPNRLGSTIARIMPHNVIAWAEASPRAKAQGSAVAHSSKA